MKLYLMRHGEALSPQEDPERGLSNNGKFKIESVAKHLQQQDLTLQHVYHSTKKRAQQTAEIMAHIISPGITPVAHKNITPNDDPTLILAEINNWKEDTLITSHLPFIPNLMTLLTGKDAFLSAITFETGTIICLKKENNSVWEMEWATCPSEL
ncbi:MAG: phosphohistidine phosphatase SixA [Gammaproteobacteria bacterium]|nr:phosphohistidine phosphatase SixA [Gammaproteobacteria bacterium]MDH5659698.1 phosphohistidine phosphatase SixA [Gammaproteobacteria bacterium]